MANNKRYIAKMLAVDTYWTAAIESLLERHYLGRVNSIPTECRASRILFDRLNASGSTGKLARKFMLTMLNSVYVRKPAMMVSGPSAVKDVEMIMKDASFFIFMSTFNIGPANRVLEAIGIDPETFRDHTDGLVFRILVQKPKLSKRPNSNAFFDRCETWNKLGAEVRVIGNGVKTHFKVLATDEGFHVGSWNLTEAGIRKLREYGEITIPMFPMEHPVSVIPGISDDFDPTTLVVAVFYNWWFNVECNNDSHNHENLAPPSHDTFSSAYGGFVPKGILPYEEVYGITRFCLKALRGDANVYSIDEKRMEFETRAKPLHNKDKVCIVVRDATKKFEENISPGDIIVIPSSTGRTTRWRVVIVGGVDVKERNDKGVRLHVAEDFVGNIKLPWRKHCHQIGGHKSEIRHEALRRVVNSYLRYVAERYYVDAEACAEPFRNLDPCP